MKTTKYLCAVIRSEKLSKKLVNYDPEIKVVIPVSCAQESFDLFLNPIQIRSNVTVYPDFPLKIPRLVSSH